MINLKDYPKRSAAYSAALLQSAAVPQEKLQNCRFTSTGMAQMGLTSVHCIVTAQSIAPRS